MRLEGRVFEGMVMLNWVTAEGTRLARPILDTITTSSLTINKCSVFLLSIPVEFIVNTQIPASAPPVPPQGRQQAANTRPTHRRHSLLDHP